MKQQRFNRKWLCTTSNKTKNLVAPPLLDLEPRTAGDFPFAFSGSFIAPAFSQKLKLSDGGGGSLWMKPSKCGGRTLHPRGSVSVPLFSRNPRGNAYNNINATHSRPVCGGNNKHRPQLVWWNTLQRFKCNWRHTHACQRRGNESCVCVCVCMYVTTHNKYKRFLIHVLSRPRIFLGTVVVLSRTPSLLTAVAPHCRLARRTSWDAAPAAWLTQ